MINTYLRVISTTTHLHTTVQRSTAYKQIVPTLVGFYGPTSTYKRGLSKMLPLRIILLVKIHGIFNDFVSMDENLTCVGRMARILANFGRVLNFSSKSNPLSNQLGRIGMYISMHSRHSPWTIDTTVQCVFALLTINNRACQVSYLPTSSM